MPEDTIQAQLIEIERADRLLRSWLAQPEKIIDIRRLLLSIALVGCVAICSRAPDELWPRVNYGISRR